MAVKTHEVEANAEELAALRRMWPALLKQYEGEYVALLNGRVVGHDPDDERLVGRLFDSLGDVPFYVARVESTGSPLDIPSPEFVP